MNALGGLGALLLLAAVAGCGGEKPRAALPPPVAFAACQTTETWTINYTAHFIKNLSQ